MSVHVLHHGRCFDGAASAALFAAFARARLTCQPLRFVPKHHCRGNPFVDEDFACDWAACVDFRYSQDPRLTWYFDHHRSAFSSPGDRAHFDADTSGQKFHDASATSCALYLAQILAKRFAYDLSAHQDLIDWADRIDAARFRTPQSAINLDEPAMYLAAYIRAEDSEAAITGFIEDLLTQPLSTLCQASYVRDTMDPQVRQHQADIQAVKAASTLRDEVVVYDLLDAPGRILNHFIPYFHHPSARYAVGGYRHLDGDLRITVGFNPWHASEDRHFDLAALCETFGGGGHPYVAGCTFGPGEDAAARRAMKGIESSLKTQPKA